MSFNIAVAGLHAAHKRMEVAGNNIANVGTSGFKSSRAEFSAVYSSSALGGSGSSSGDGVRLADVSQNFKAGGAMSSQGRPLDMRIEGKGFFVMSDGGALSYTRSGAFHVDAENFVVDPQGGRLQGYGVNAEGKLINGLRSDLKIDTANIAPKPTSKLEQTLNLDSASASLAALPHFNPDDPRTYTRVVTHTIQDAGVPEVRETKGKNPEGDEIVLTPAKAAIPPQDHELKQYFVKTDDTTWTSYILIDGINPLDPSSMSPLEVGLHTDANGKLSLSGNSGAVSKTSDVELALNGWQPAVKVNGGWTPSDAASAGPIKLPLDDVSGALLDPADAVMLRPVPAFDPSDITTFNKMFTTGVFDSLGNQHQMTQYFVKDGSNSWKMHVLVDGRNPQNPERTDPVTASMLFDARGNLQSLVGGKGLVGANQKLTLDNWVPAKDLDGVGAGKRWGSNGASANADGIVLDMSKLSQYRADTALISPVTDGHAAGEMRDLSIDRNGIISAGFSNGVHRKIGQVMLAGFTNEQGLQPISGTRWKETHESGIANYDGAAVGSLGSIVGRSLEGSNVDMSQELVDLIQAQTAYQANSKTLSTEAEMMQTLIRAT
ncbi:flagellar biosynthesis protein FlgE [Pseudomonas sp. Bc-h]|uniref:flagellar hook protein FlgE n=1 Tax=Pseudomonas sp. Bc-h TaxID=1943632 RepID=UPI0009D9F4B5|nr:flagellar hook protein FlgE [Pseudomonas sp. Bc-h]OQR26963.1 flagellar biosynthesis protein FlgE [Pseudomonas sp. Bc-h]